MENTLSNSNLYNSSGKHFKSVIFNKYKHLSLLYILITKKKVFTMSVPVFTAKFVSCLFSPEAGPEQASLQTASPLIGDSCFISNTDR